MTMTLRKGDVVCTHPGLCSVRMFVMYPPIDVTSLYVYKGRREINKGLLYPHLKDHTTSHTTSRAMGMFDECLTWHQQQPEANSYTTAVLRDLRELAARKRLDTLKQTKSDTYLIVTILIATSEYREFSWWYNKCTGIGMNINSVRLTERFAYPNDTDSRGVRIIGG